MFKNIKITAICLALIFYANKSSAQNDADALRYSMLNYGSTARSLAMGNSFGALGADFSNLSINPAGLGLYRRTEFTLSPMFSLRSINSEYRGNTNYDDAFKFSFGNFGAVFTMPNKKAGASFKNWSFGFGYNKLNDFNADNIALGNNTQHSLADNWLEQLDGVAPEDIPTTYPFDIDLAWQTFLIDTIGINGQQYYYNQIPFAGTQQTRRVDSRGGQGEWVFSVGTNYQEKLFLGMTFGLSTLEYNEESRWIEEDNADTIPGFKSFNYYQSLNTSGTGFNMKFGAIYKPNDAIRLGLAIHTPTWMTLTDNYFTNIRTDLQDGQLRTYDSPVYVPYVYELKTPFRVISSLGIIAGKSAAINIEYEFLDYSQSKMDDVDFTSNNYFYEVNSIIRSNYTTSHNFKAGAEIRNNNLRFRFGGLYSTSPFSKNLNLEDAIDQASKGLTAGFGIKEERFFIDFAFAHTQTGYYYQPYTLNNQEVSGITSKQKDNRFLITIGFVL
jgi:hypothetical protein